MSDQPLVLADINEGVGRLTFNRPAARNAMTVAMMAELHEKLAVMEADPAVRCIVLTGANGDFVAGGDIKGWAHLLTMSPAERGEDFRKRLATVRPLILLLESLSKPLVAAVNGYAAGAGICFVAAADFVMADSGAKFLFANVKMGLVPDMGLSHFLPRAVGRRAAARLAMMSGQVDATEAHALGLVTELVDADAFDESLARLTRRVVGLPPVSLRLSRDSMRRPDLEALATCFDNEVDGLAESAATPEFLAALSAFLEPGKGSKSG